MPSVPSTVASTLADLVRINSVNPAFSDGSTNEREIASYVAQHLTDSGLDVLTLEDTPGRPSVVGRLRGTGRGPTLMLYAHMDTVGVEGMTDPFGADVRDGKLFGRGAYDMKGGLAACLEAARILAAGPRLGSDVIVAAVADEETASLGMEEVLRHVQPDAAIVTEPTELDVCIAHKGFCWIAVETQGRAAHGSRPDLGIDANLMMGRVLQAVAALERDLRNRAPHPLVGPPSVHVGTIVGGTGPSIYAARCRIEIERRTIPGESIADALSEIEDVVAALRAGDPSFDATCQLLLARSPFEVDRRASIVDAVTSASQSVLGRSPTVGGQTPWMDAALLAEVGTETVVIGPAGTGAHADEEWVELESVALLTDVLVAAARQWDRAPSAAR